MKCSSRYPCPFYHGLLQTRRMCTLKLAPTLTDKSPWEWLLGHMSSVKYPLHPLLLMHESHIHSPPSMRMLPLLLSCTVSSSLFWTPSKVSSFLEFRLLQPLPGLHNDFSIGTGYQLTNVLSVQDCEPPIGARGRQCIVSCSRVSSQLIAL